MGCFARRSCLCGLTLLVLCGCVLLYLCLYLGLCLGLCLYHRRRYSIPKADNDIDIDMAVVSCHFRRSAEEAPSPETDRLSRDLTPDQT